MIRLIEDWERQCFSHLQELSQKYGFRFSRKTKRNPSTGEVTRTGNEHLNGALRMNFEDLDAEARQKFTVYAVNHFFRMIVPRPRKVIECEGIVCPPELQGGYDALKKELASGAPMFHRLSRRIKEFDFADGMYNDWGIVHFHLGTKPDAKRRWLVQGGKQVAYAYLTDNEAYIISIADHDKERWTDEKFLEILSSQYPAAIQPWTFDQESEGISTVSSEQRSEFRNCGINLFTKIGDKTFMAPFGGMTGDGTLVRAVMLRNRIYHALQALERFIEANYEKIQSLIGKAANDVEPEFRFAGLRMAQYGVVWVIDIPTHKVKIIKDDWGIVLSHEDEESAISALERHRMGEEYIDREGRRMENPLSTSTNPSTFTFD